MRALIFDLETADSDKLHSYGPKFVRIAGWKWSDEDEVHTSPDVRPLLAAIGRADLVVGHDVLRFDLVALARWHGLDLDELVRQRRVFDTILAARQADPPRSRGQVRHDLDSVAKRLKLGAKSTDLRKLKRKHGGFDKIPVDDPEYVAYLRTDVEITAAIFEALHTNDPYVDREHRIAGIMAQIMLSGFRLDLDLLAERIRQVEEAKAEALQVLHEDFGVPLEGKAPLRSDAGKAALIEAFKAAGASYWPKTETGQLMTSKDGMAEMAREFPGNRDVQRICELVSTVEGQRAIYETVDRYRIGDRAHCDISASQATGRWSFKNPGLTVLGKRSGRHVERDVFVPEPGHVMLCVDLNQVDARAVAALSGDPAYAELFTGDVDAHGVVASMVWGGPPDKSNPRREDAKAISHGWNYGRGAKAIAEGTGVSLRAAMEFDRAMRTKFPLLVRWQEQVREQARSGELMDNGWGRNMRPDSDRAHTQAPAFMGQSAARDIMAQGLLRLPAALRPLLRGVIHDEVVLSVPEDEADEVREEVVDAFTFVWKGVQITAGAAPVGRSWGDVYEQEKRASAAIQRKPEVDTGSRESGERGGAVPEAATEVPTSENPFEHADDYRARGWIGTLPLPARSKHSPPKHFTGYGGLWPLDEDLYAWSEDRRYRKGANLAIRLPETVIGIDVDAYDGKPGLRTIEQAQLAHGELPATWTSTSRLDGSGIRFYRVPAGRAWADEVGPGVEVIHHGHRYAVVWPSVHPEGGTYRWISPDGQPAGEPPWTEELPELPDSWRMWLDRGPVDGVPDKATVTNADVSSFLDELPDGDECPVIAQRTDEAIEGLTVGSRHNSMRDGVLALVFYGNQGHRGGRAGLARLRAAFEESTSHRDPGEWQRAVTGAVAMTPRLADKHRRCCDEDGPGNEDAFWTSRPVLENLRTFARARRVSPWAMLGCVLAIVASRVGPHVVLPPQIGGKASLNLLVGLVGRSGAGKDTALAAAQEFLWQDHTVPVHELGTGQGIDSSYVEQTKDGPVQFNDSALFTLSEIDSLAGHAKMQGPVLLATLKKAYTGAQLGARYADKTKRRPVKPHHYRFALIAGIQPTHAKVLLDDADGGTPQRWLWLPVVDPDAPDAPPEEPIPSMFGVPVELQAQGELDGPYTRPADVVLNVCEAAVVAADRRRIAQLRGQGDPDGKDGHELLTQRKVAALLSFLDGRAEVSEADWGLAETVMRVSAQTRRMCEQAIAAKRRKSVEARAVDKVVEAEVVEARRDERVERVADKLVKALRNAPGGLSRSQLRKELASRDRPVFEAALDHLVSEELIEVESKPDKRAPDGTARHYRLSGGVE